MIFSGVECLVFAVGEDAGVGHLSLKLELPAFRSQAGAWDRAYVWGRVCEKDRENLPLRWRHEFRGVLECSNDGMFGLELIPLSAAIVVYFASKS